MNITEKELIAQQLVIDAKNKYKSFFGRLFGNKYEEALEKYEQATNIYKLIKKWDYAADIYVLMAEINLHKLKFAHDAACNYSNAAYMYKKNNINKAIHIMNLAIDINIDSGNFSLAAKQEKIVAEMYEENTDNKKAMYHYSLAADYYEIEHSTGNANRMKLKKAYYLATLKQYKQAITIYKKVAIDSVNNILIRFSVKDYLFRAMLCHLAFFAEQDELNRNIELCISAHEEYINIDVNYEDSREGILIQSLLKGIEEENFTVIMSSIRDYDRINKLDFWKSSMLLKIKELYDENDSDDEN